MTTAPRVFLGTGLMGSAMAERALKQGQRVRVWNRSPAKAEALKDFGAEVAYEPEAAVEQAVRVHITLSSDDAVDAVLDRCLDALSPETIVIDHSTTSPAGTAKRFERCRRQQKRYLHAPVFMSPIACRKGAGSMLVAGAEADYQAVEAELQAMTGKLWYVGDQATRAATFKLIGNGLILSLVGALADVYALGQNMGIDPKDCQQLFDIWDPNFVLRGRGLNMAQGQFETLWSLTMARKDIGLMLEAAGDQQLSLLPALAARMDGLIQEQHGERDVGILALASAANSQTPE